MILFIDSSNFTSVHFALIGSKVTEKNVAVDPHKSFQLIKHLDGFLRKSKITNPKSAIAQIIACKGPGSYTGVRMGVTIAQALGYAWGVPVKFIATEKIPKDLAKYTQTKKRLAK